MGNKQSSGNNKQNDNKVLSEVEHNLNHVVEIIVIIGGIWALLNLIGILLFFILVDRNPGNIIRRLFGFGRNIALFSGQKTLKDMQTRIDLLQQQVNTMTPQKGGSRKGLYSIKSLLAYFNICLLLGFILLLTLFPSYLINQNSIPTEKISIPSFSIY